MLWWVSITPLGKPVVPEVYCMLITSWQVRLAEARASSSSLVWEPRRRSSCVLYIPRCFCGPMKITLSSRGNRALRSRPRSQDFSSGTNSLSMAT